MSDLLNIPLLNFKEISFRTKFMSTKKISLQTVVTIFLGLVLCVVVLRSLSSILQPLMIALFFCYLVIPFRNFLCRHKCPQTLANILLPILVILFLIVFSWIIIQNVQTLYLKLPEYRVKMEGMLKSIFSLAIQYVPDLKARIQSIDIPTDKILGFVGSGMGTFLGFLKNFLSTSMVVGFFLVFLLLESRVLPDRIIKAYGKKRGEEIQKLIIKINQGVLTYIKVKTAVSFLVAALCSIILFFFGVDLWLFWGIIIFLANFIPYVGSILAVIPPILVCILQTGYFVKPFFLSVMLVLAQTFVGNFLEPKIAGKVLNLSPLLVIISLAFWAWLWGIVGMVLAVPILVSIKIILEHLPSTHSFAQLMGDRAQSS